MEWRKGQNRNSTTQERFAECRAFLCKLYTVVDNSDAFSTVFFVPFYFLFFCGKTCYTVSVGGLEIAQTTVLLPPM